MTRTFRVRWIIHKLLTLDKGKKPTNHKNLGEISRRSTRLAEEKNMMMIMMMMVVENNNDPRRKSGRPRGEMVHDFRRGLKIRNIIIYPVKLNVFPLRPPPQRSIVKYSRRVSEKKKKNHPDKCKDLFDTKKDHYL